jgi:hypothetical protein
VVDGPIRGSCFRGSVTISKHISKESQKCPGLLQTLSVVPAPFITNSSMQEPGLGLQYLERNIRFCQIWVLSSDLEMSTTLGAFVNTQEVGQQHKHIIAPTMKSAQFSNLVASLPMIDDYFVVPDGLDDESASIVKGNKISSQHNGQTISDAKAHNDLRMRVNSRKVFQRVFMDVSPDDLHTIGDHSRTSSESMAELLLRIESCIQQANQHGSLAMPTL